jgi:uncharacterized protein
LSGKPIGFQVAEEVKPRLADAHSAAEIAAIVIDARALTLALHEVHRTHTPHQRVSCANGCTYCCHIRVETSPMEVIALMWWLGSRFDESNLQQIRARVEQADETTHGLSEMAHAASGMACPLLVSEHCSAYDARPFDCQGYESMDETICRRALANYQIRDIPLNAPRYRAFLEARQAMNMVASRLGRQGEVLELTSALRIALNTDDVVARWISGDAVFDGAVINDNR